MTNNEIKVLRANLLGGMDAYVREMVQDEDNFDYWLMYGVPDGSDEDDLMEIAESEDNFNQISHAFAWVLKLEQLDEKED